MTAAHGTYSRYTNGRCRCELCRAAKAAYMRKRRKDPAVREPEKQQQREYMRRKRMGENA